MGRNPTNWNLSLSQAGESEGGDGGAGAGQRSDREFVFLAQSDQSGSRIGYSGCAGIGDQADGFVRFKFFDDKGFHLGFIEFVVAFERDFDFVMTE